MIDRQIVAWPRKARRVAIAAAVASLLGTGSASAHYIGPTYLRIPGVTGTAKVPQFKGWIRSESHYWTDRPRAWNYLQEIMQFSGPKAPAKGPSMLAIAVRKADPAYKPMMEACGKGTAIPQVNFAESSHLARNPFEHGRPPSDVPQYYEYTLKNVRLACPVAEGAPEQAFTLHFDEIEWLNYKPYDKVREVTAEPAKFSFVPRPGKTRTAALTWFSNVADSRDDQCPKMNSKPTQEDYYRHLSPERAAHQRVALASTGGADQEVLMYRGPGELNVTMLPGTVPDPGFLEPQPDKVMGLNLDGDDGSRPPKGVRKHPNFVAPWGEKGIDNQMFLVEGCVEGLRRRGFWTGIGNDMIATGSISILVHVSGINDERNDDEVAVDFLFSHDPMRRDATGKVFLNDYTFRLSEEMGDKHDFVRFKGKIVNGAVITESLDKMYLRFGGAAGYPLWNPRMRLEFKPDGSMTGVLGGYRDWREYIGIAFFQKDWEDSFGYNSPGMYNALRRAADGMQDPDTGEYLGISSAYVLEGIPAFLAPEQEKQLASQ